MNKIFTSFKITKLVVVFFLLILSISSSRAGEIVWTQFLNGINVAATKEISMSDLILRGKYNSAEYDYKVSFVYGRELRKDYVLLENSFNFTVTYTIEYLNQDMVVQSQTTGNTLTINFNPINPDGIVYEAHSIFNTPTVDYEKVKLTITNITTGAVPVPDDVRLELSLISKTSFDFTATAPLLNFDVAKQNLYWSYMKGADSYQIEWVYVDKEDFNTAYPNGDIVFSNTALAFDYKEPVRILLKEQYFDKFNFTYPAGKVYFRVRGVGKYAGVGSESEKYSSWYYVASPYSISTTFESNKNWQYVTSFAEDAKFKKVITYYDGSLRNRQVLTNLSSEELIVGGETKYDFEGRPVLNVLPVPVAQSSLAYINNMNYFSGGKADYDKLMNTDHSLTLNASSKAAIYYSSSNPDINKPGYGFLPDAEGYPYSQVIYTKDGTGRPLRQSGVGLPFHLGAPGVGGKNTVYKYSTANDTELRRLFGGNVGNAAHYKKNYVIDPNGQISVSYLDQEGRVVATCLTGNTPNNLTSLTSNLVVPITVNLSASNTIDKENKISKSVSVINNVLENINYTFKYDLNGVINQSTLMPLVCKECVYDLVFTITDPDDVIAYTQTVVDIRPDAPVSCSTNVYSKNLLINTTVNFSKIGEYKISKELRLSSSALDVMVASIKTDPNAEYPKLSTYETAFLAKVYAGNCDLTCSDNCKTEVLRANPIWAASPSSYVNEINNAVNNCVTTTCPSVVDAALERVSNNECKSIYSQIEAQIRPGGVYNTNNTWLTAALLSIDAKGGFKDANNNTLLIQPTITDLQTKSGFKDDWVDELISEHREFCHFKNCIKLTPSRIFDKKMAVVKDWTEAKAKGYINETTNANPLDFPDPMFDPVLNLNDQATSQARASFLGKLNSFTTEPTFMFLDTSNDGLVSLEEFVSSYVPYGTNPNSPPSDALKWQYYRSFYNGFKVLEERKLIGAASSTYTLPGSIYKDLQASGYQGCPYTSDANTIIKDPNLPTDMAAINLKNYQNMRSSCQSLCPENAKVWLSMIENRCAKLTSNDYNSIRDLFISYCNANCNYDDPLGLIFTEKLTDPTLVSIQNILNSNPAYNSCNLNIIAVEDPYNLSCSNKYGIEMKGWNVSSCSNNGCFSYTGIPTSVPNFQGVLSNINYGDSRLNRLFPYPMCDRNTRATLRTYLKTPADGLYGFTLNVDNAANIYIDGVLKAAGDFNICYFNNAVINVPQFFLSAGYHELYIEYAQGLGGQDLYLQWSINGSPLELIPDMNYYYEIPANETNQMCVVTGFNECPLDFNSANDCTNNPIFISSCGEKVLNALNTLIQHQATANPHACNLTTFPLVLNKPENVNVSGCSFFSTQMMLELPESCNGDGKKQVLVVKDNTSFKLYAGNNAAAYQTACACSPGTNYFTTNALSQEIKFYTTNTAGTPTYIDPNTIAYIKDPYVNCDSARSPNALGFKTSFGIAVKLGIINGQAINEILAYVEASNFASSDSHLTWKVPGLPPRTLCNNTYTIDWLALKNECIAKLNETARIEAYKAWKEAEEKFISDFVNEQVDRCFSNPFNENLYYSYSNNEYHYTLYYYDQAGNLIQTVPPAGVVPLDVTNTAIFDTKGNYIPGPSGEPNHRLVTKYRYNSLNQLTWQTTPDGGETYFWYDSKGQLRLSQNDKQLAESGPTTNRYSYTRYDRQGRIEEVGQLEDHSMSRALMANIASEKDVLALLDNGAFPAAATQVLKQITATVYDAGGDSQQDNLRGRVVLSVSKPTTSTTDVTTRYSYDPHGNVKSLRQDITGFTVKQTDYEYDLISGKVNKVYYQKAQSDQFVHKYDYDSDNRIKAVFTSVDDMVWEEDAHYFYYKHGPLSRIELGQDKVQGLDYYYTLQGWLKGVNIPALRTENLTTGKARATADIGYDGIIAASNTNIFVGQDEFAYALGYFNGDYKPIQSGLALYAAGTNNWTALSPNIKANGLYNGNIATMVTQIHNLGDKLMPGANFDARQVAGLKAYAYQYDQLNRIAQGAFYNQYNNTTGWAARTSADINKNAYDAKYEYDPNGNILIAKINGQTGVSLMDDLSYNYNYASSYLQNNRLNYVADPMGVTEGTDLPSTQALNNYQYDAIGNLTSDLSEGIGSITWSVYGKVLTVMNNSTTKADLTFTYDAVGNRVKKVSYTPSTGATITTYYIRDASGNVMATYELETSTTIRFNIYGSSRLGTVQSSSLVNGAYIRKPYLRQYELSNHLGNVLATVSAVKLGVILSGSNKSDYYFAYAISGQDYYPFGMTMPGRFYSSPEYRYGFNGMEKDDEIKGNGNSFTTLHRIYDPRLGQWLSVDPETDEYPDESPYVSMENNPISETDPDGDCPWCIAALKGAVQEYGTQVIMNLADGKDLGDALTDVDGGEIVKAAVIDGLTMGLGGIVKKAQTAVKVVKAADKLADAEKAAVKVNKVANTTQKVSKVEKNVVKVEKKLPPACFIKGTLILTSKGLKPIEFIVKGDSVWAFSDSLNIIAKQVVYNTVIRQTNQLIILKIGNSTILTTPEHPFYIENSWIKAKDIKQGDSVLLFNNIKVAIIYKGVKDTACTVYNFTVENFHTYFVSNISVLVHNDNCSAELPTSKAARRESMRKAGIPTSQPLQPDKLAKGKDKVLLTRDKKNVVMDAKNDVSHQGKPHWEAGKTKQNPNSPDGLNRSGSNNNKPQIQNQGKEKTYYRLN